MRMPFRLNLPDFDIRLSKKENAIFVWDRLRRKYVALTPEEWVRQHFVNYLIAEKGYPEGLMSNEKQIILNGTRKRCDTIVYDRSLSPLVIIEYKSPDVTISQDVFEQIARYDIVLKVGYLFVSNGMEHYCCKMDYEKQSFSFLREIPLYSSL